MNKRFIAFNAVSVLLLAAMLPLVCASVSAGLKKGDWIEYQVSASGTFPGEANAKWARIEVTNVQDVTTELNITTQLVNGTFVYLNISLNFEAGQLAEGLFIPPNLSVGDVFYDSYVGNITITGTSQRTYAGAERAVLSGTTQYNSYLWDKLTGALVEAHSNYPEQGYNVTTVADKTNMWQAQSVGFEPESLILFAVLFAAVAIGVALGLRRRRKRVPL
jgi:hypothetical protein